MDERLQFVARRLADGGTLQGFGIPRKTGAFRFRAGIIPPQQARGLVAPPGDRHRTDQTGPPSAERSSRTHASHLEKRSHQTRSWEFSSTAGPLR